MVSLSSHMKQSTSDLAIHSGQSPEAFTLYNCVFLDILGYKEKSAAYFDQRFNLYEKINRALSVADMAQKWTGPAFNTDGLTIEIMSDSIILMQPAMDAGFEALLPFTCQMVCILSLEGLFVRGGIAQGRHIRKKTEQGFDFLASEALQKAFHLESKVAINPRILIHNDLINALNSCDRKHVIREGDDFILHFAQYVLSEHRTDADGIYAEMKAIQGEMNGINDDKIRAKYQWLLDYYHWSIANSSLWDSNRFQVFCSGTRRYFAKL